MYQKTFFVLGGLLAVSFIMLSGCPNAREPEDTKAVLRDAFTRVDEDANGLLAFAEARLALADLSLAEFNALDADADGFLSLAELSDMPPEGETEGETEVPDCSYELAALTQHFSAAGGQGTIDVATGETCTWAASSEDDWIDIHAHAVGVGPGTVEYAVAVNQAPPRTGIITVAGRTFTITQEDGCTYAVLPAGRSVSLAGGAASFQVAAGPSCEWTAESDAPWLTVVSGSEGAGDGTVEYEVAANLGPARSAAISIAGERHTVEQADGCFYAVTATPQDFSASGGTGAITVAAGTGCDWAPATDVAWITLAAPAFGSGYGSVAFTVAANPGPARRGAIVVGGEAATVNQADGCVTTIQPAGRDFASGSGFGTITVRTGPDCPWTVENSVDWISIDSPAAGSGPASVAYAVAANAGPARSAVISVAGRPHEVHQADGCIFTLDPEEGSIPQGGGGVIVSVSTHEGCAWTAVCDVPWIHVLSQDAGSFAYIAFQNMGPARNGTVTVGNAVHRIHQDDGCSYTVTPAQRKCLTTGGTGSFTITCHEACPWRAASSADWLAITSAASGTGTATITYSAAPSTVGARSASIEVEEHVHTVTQLEGNILVDTLADTLDGNASSVESLAAAPGPDGAVSLREAIIAANNTPGADVIRFAVAGGILPSLPLPPLSDARGGTTIAGDGLIGISGANGLSRTASGLVLYSAHNLVKGLSIYRFAGHGIQISGQEARFNAVQDCLIGIYRPTPSAVFSGGNGYAGIAIEDGASDNLIGGAGARQGNSICRNQVGILISGEGACRNVIQGNYIGMCSGSAAYLGNTFGIQVSDGACDNVIGGIAPGEGNQVQSNGSHGVQIRDWNSIGNQIRGNSIGNNGGLGISLVGGANDFIEPPNITGLSPFMGDAEAFALIDFYADAQDEGLVYFGTLSAAEDGTFYADVDLSVYMGINITATATDAAGNTSEFGIYVPPPPCPVPRDLAVMLAQVWPFVDLNGDMRLSRAEVLAVYPYPNEVDEYIFPAADTNGDAYISWDEVTAETALAFTDFVYDSIDENGNGGFEPEELELWVTPAQFDLLDVNNNGVIDCEDMVTGPPEVVQSEGETPCPVPRDLAVMLAQVWPLVDLNGDTLLSRGELLAVCLSPEDITDYLLPLVDRNDDDYISWEEAIAQAPLTDSLVAIIDQNGDGCFDLEELESLMLPVQFDILDVNDNGLIDCEDMVNDPPEAAENDGETPCPLPHDFYALRGLVWPVVDANHDGAISLGEAKAAWLDDADVDALFDWLDDNGNGLFELEESEALAFEIDLVFAVFDQDGDNLVDYDEAAPFLPQGTFLQLDHNSNGYIDCGDLE